MFSEIAKFTHAASEQPLPKKPRCMTEKEVENLGRFVVEELFELFDTTFESQESSNEHMLLILSKEINRKKRQRPSTEEEVMANQIDAIIDMAYFGGDAGAKAGFKLDQYFGLVQNSNMAKVNPETGKVIRREGDNKILKPEGWTPPDILSKLKEELRQNVE
jgi:predicted HAD superfamily Cof-like phosphohydrolase